MNSIMKVAILFLLAMILFASGCILEQKKLNSETGKTWVMGNFHTVFGQYWLYKIDNCTMNYEIGNIPVKWNPPESSNWENSQVIGFGSIKFTFDLKILVLT